MLDINNGYLGNVDDRVRNRWVLLGSRRGSWTGQMFSKWRGLDSLLFCCFKESPWPRQLAEDSALSSDPREWGAWQEAENSHCESQRQIRESKLEKVQGFLISKSTLSDILPSTGPHLLNFSKQLHWRPKTRGQVVNASGYERCFLFKPSQEADILESYRERK